MATIEKKILKESFEAISSGKKRYEIRLNDFEVREGDTLFLREWDPDKKEYTGRSIEKKVLYVGKIDLEKYFWPKEEIEEKGLQVISIE